MKLYWRLKKNGKWTWKPVNNESILSFVRESGINAVETDCRN